MSKFSPEQKGLGSEMAEAVVSFAVERLEELLRYEAKLLYGVRDQIIEVKRELQRMQCFLEEADRIQNRDKRVRKWVTEMRELAFKTEDVIETFAMEIPTKKQKSRFKDILRRSACIMSEGVSRRNISMEIDAIKAELDYLTKSLPTYGITKGLEEGETSNAVFNLKGQRTSYSHDVEKDFVGMENEIEQLISHLKNQDKGCEVVSICGMGGQGKTTLAKKLYNHVEVKAYFKASAWVCITQQFDKEKVLKGVLKELLPAERKEEVSRMGDAELVKEIYKVQQDKNCLIVIDDIWTVVSWKILESAFPVGETTSGSKILLTTRVVKVAEIGSVYKIHGLTEDEGWQLLSKKAEIYDLLEKSVASEMERIGRNMVRRCRGLPLAISSLGGVLKGKLLREWEIINKDISFYLAKGEGVTNDDDDEYYTVTKVLGLSYDNLPPRLKHCFLCFANYKEDEEIQTEELYMFWMAEGLISVKHKAEGEMMLDVAERYLDELTHRSLVQIETISIDKTPKTSWSKYRTCRVHDLIRDLCLSKVKEEKVINVIHLQRKPDDECKANIVRRLCIRSYIDGDESMLKPYDQHVISHIRSLLIRRDFDSGTQGEWPEKILNLEKFKLLRVLTADRYKITKQNIRRISELVFLKYLCLRRCYLEEFPVSIGNLGNLETLDLREIGYVTIPNVIWKLKQLKYLYLPERFKGVSVEDGNRVEKLRLEGLNELEVIENYDSLNCDVGDLIRLQKLKILKGTIGIHDNLTGENIIDIIKSRELRHSQLEISGEGEGGLCLVLLLECCFIDELTIFTDICRFPKEYDHTRFSVRLTILWLFDCRMEEDPMILLEKLPNLRHLTLFYNVYLGAKMICSATGFPQLENLYFNRLPCLREWRLEEGAMPKLFSLDIGGCKELEMLPQELRYLKALDSLCIFNMPTTFTEKIDVKDGVQGEDYYKIGHIRTVIIV